MPTNQNAALFSLLGNRFGGTGPANFALPDLRGRAGVDDGWESGNIYPLGQTSGTEKVTLTTASIPQHSHSFNAAATVANKNAPASNYFAQVSTSPTPNTIYAADSSNRVSLHPSTLNLAGGGAGHNNMQPSLVVNFCIATTGLYPTRN